MHREYLYLKINHFRLDILILYHKNITVLQQIITVYFGYSTSILNTVKKAMHVILSWLIYSYYIIIKCTIMRYIITVYSDHSVG